MSCTASALLEKDFPDTTSEYAKEGTLAHEICELKLRKYFFTTEMAKTAYTRAVNKLKKDPLYAPEMEGFTDTYLEFVKSEALRFNSKPYVAIEKRLDLTSYIPDGFGTADCIIICGDTLEVIDFKYGRSPDGRVQAENNPQMMIYALGAYAAYSLLYDIRQVRLAIVQPRLDDGITTWDTDIKNLLTFGEQVKEKAAEALSGNGHFAPDPHTCKFCRARSRCRARAEKNVELAFAVDKKPPLLTNEEVGEYIKKGADISKWLEELKDYALGECLAGGEVPGWKAVEGRSTRAFTDMDAAFARLEENGIDHALLWQYTPISLAKAETTVGKKSFNDIVGDLIVKTPGKPTLAPAEDKRPAITNQISAKEAFAEGV
jgi:hypothetical protein